MHCACLSKHNSNGEKQTILQTKLNKLLMIQTEKDGITLQQQDYWY